MNGPAFKLPPLKPSARVVDARPELAAKRHLMALGAECWRCPLAKFPSVPTQWQGEGSPPLAVIGEAPARREILARQPFVGQSGKVLNYALGQAGIDRRRLAVMNAIACGPIPTEQDTVKRVAAECCRPRLIAELRALRPKGLMALGANALKSLAPEGSSGVTALRGAKLDVADDIPSPSWQPQALFSTFHPAHIARGGDGEEKKDDTDKSVDALYYFLLFDIAKAWNYVHGAAHEWAVRADLFIDVDGRTHRALVENDTPIVGDVATEADVRAALGRVYEEARAHGSLTCDVETDSKDSWDAHLTAIGYGTPHGGVCATWNVWQAFPSVTALILEIHRARLRWNWQNGIYDRIVLRRHKIAGKSLIVVGQHEDTLLKHHAAFPGLPHRLDSIAAQFYVVRPWKNEFRTSTRNLPELVWYCVNDVVCTARLELAIGKHIPLVKTTRVYEADRQLNVVATEMRAYGCYIDREEQARHRATQTARLEYMKTQVAEKFAAIEGPWREALARLQADKQRKADPDSFLERVAIRYKEIAERDRGPTNIGMFKPKAKLDLVALFNVLKIPVKAWTKTGLPVTDKKALEAAAARHPLMRWIDHLRSAQHLIANYVELPVKEDGRFHPDWKTTKITGRWGAGRSQNVPNTVPSWPPKLRPDKTFALDDNGDYICNRDNLRSMYTAPTAEGIIAIARRGRHLVDRWVLSRAERGHGRMLVGADEDQVELRIVGFLSREEFLLRIFNENRDPHSEFARNVIFPREFPKLEKEIAEAGFKPKQVGKVEGLLAVMAGRDEDVAKARESKDITDEDVKAYGVFYGRDDDIARAKREKLLDILRAMLGWKHLRDLSKRAEYGSLYRGEAPTIWEAIVKDFPKTTLIDVENMLRSIHEAMPGVVAWWNECDTYARQFRETREAWLGRVRLFPLGNFDPTVAVNFPVQAYNAGLMATATFRFIALTRPEWLEFEPLYRMRLLDAKWVNARRAEGFAKWHAPITPILQVHDSLVAETDEEDADKCCKLLTLCMDQEDYNRKHDVRMRYTGEARKSRRWSRT